MKENEWMNKRLNEKINERVNEWKKEWKKESWGCLNCELQTYRTLKQRYCNGLLNIHTNTLEIVNIYSVIQAQWTFTLWWSDEWMNEKNEWKRNK